MLRSVFIYCFLVLIMLFSTSCSYFKRSNDKKVIFTVKSSSLNVRKSTNVKSEIIGRLMKGDTIIPNHRVHPFITWVGFDYNDGKGYVVTKYLTSHSIPDKEKVSNMKLGKVQTIIRDYLTKYVNWRTGMFWLIVLIAVVVIPLLSLIFNYIDRHLYWDGDEYPWSRLPFITAIIGATFSIVYLFWRESLLQAIFVTNILWIPESNDWMPWYLWTSIVVSVFIFLFFFVKNIFYYGILGVIRIFYYTIIALVSFIGAIFVGVALVVVSIVMLLLSLVGGEGGSNVRIPISTSGSTEAEKAFARSKRYEQWDKDAERSALAGLKEKIWWKNAQMD